MANGLSFSDRRNSYSTDLVHKVEILNYSSLSAFRFVRLSFKHQSAQFIGILDPPGVIGWSYFLSPVMAVSRLGQFVFDIGHAARSIQPVTFHKTTRPGVPDEDSTCMPCPISPPPLPPSDQARDGALQLRQGRAGARGEPGDRGLDPAERATRLRRTAGGPLRRPRRVYTPLENAGHKATPAR